MRQHLDPVLLRQVIERYAEGEFHDLFEVPWDSRLQFQAAARDYVPKRDYSAFCERLHEVFCPAVQNAR